MQSTLTHTDTQTDRQTDTQTDRHTHRQTDRHTDRQTSQLYIGYCFKYSKMILEYL